MVQRDSRWKFAVMKSTTLFHAPCTVGALNPPCVEVPNVESYRLDIFAQSTVMKDLEDIYYIPSAEIPIQLPHISPITASSTDEEG